MNWLPVIILFTILIVTFIPSPKSVSAEESNDNVPR